MTRQTIRLFNSDPAIHTSFCDHFISCISSYLPRPSSITTLDKLHLIDSVASCNLLSKGTDQSTVFHKAVYSSFDNIQFINSDFAVSYYSLVSTILSDLKQSTGYSGDWAVQRYPTLRFHLPSNISVFEFHRDSDYLHPLAEINCFYALNHCTSSSALHVEQNLGFEDYSPLELDPGQYALLNTSIFKHGDFINTTGNTRVSMDFRFIPCDALGTPKTSLSSSLKFSTDSYFMHEDLLLHS